MSTTRSGATTSSFMRSRRLVPPAMNAAPGPAASAAPRVFSART